MSVSDNEKRAVVGIDLGTTYSAIAWINQSGKLEVIPNLDGSTTTPSVVYIDEDTILVGHDAIRAGTLDPENLADCFKRDMGYEHYKKSVGGEDLRPEVLSAYVLKKLKQDAEDKIGPISDAVITVPAFFDDTRRKATQDAANVAGLNILEIINEPSAAAIWYGFGKQPEIGSVFLVYDLGGGTNGVMTN